MGCGFRCFCWIYCIIYTLMFMFILSLIIFWIIISPSSVKFHVTEASLMQFNLTSNNTLYYKIYKFKVNITVRNPNNNIIVYYRKITAIDRDKDNDFAYVNLSPFDQGHKNTTFLEPAVFEGNSVIKLGAQQLREYKEETLVGIYNDLTVDLDLRIRAKYGRFKSSRFNPPIVQCRRLRVPLISNGTSDNGWKKNKNPSTCSKQGSFYMFNVQIMVGKSFPNTQKKTKSSKQLYEPKVSATEYINQERIKEGTCPIVCFCVIRGEPKHLALKTSTVIITASIS